MSSSPGGRASAEVIPDRVPAAVIDRPGAQPRLGMVRIPALAAGHSMLRVLAAPLNPLDLLIASGTFHSVRHGRPYVPGSECVGTIVQSVRYPAGTRVYAQCQAGPDMPGALATHVVVSDNDVLVLPDGFDPITSAAVSNSGIAAYLPLARSAGVQAGETVLILGATGAVGQLAIQIARALGAARVVGVGRNRTALDRLVTLGADATVMLLPDESEDDLASRVLEAAGHVDVILDGLYGMPLQAALRACGPHARVVNIGNLAGPTVQLAAGLLRSKQLVLNGFAGIHMSIQDKQSALAWLWRRVNEGALAIDLRTAPLRDIATSWSEQRASPHCKCVLVPD